MLTRNAISSTQQNARALNKQQVFAALLCIRNREMQALRIEQTDNPFALLTSN